LKDVCSEVDGLNFIGLFRPLNEPWNWAHFIGTDERDLYKSVTNEIDRKYKAKRDDITQSFVRHYSRSYDNPTCENIEQLSLLQIELDVWQGIDVGIKEYHDAHVQVFENQKGAIYQGQYRVWNDPFNWAHFYWFRDWKRALEMSDLSWRATSQPQRVSLLNTRSYERYTPD
jgi:hypothetical protein